MLWLITWVPVLCRWILTEPSFPSVDAASADDRCGYGTCYPARLMSCSPSCLQTAVAKGDLTQKITGVSVSGEMLNLVNTINDMIDQLAIFAAEVKKVAREVGTEGKLGVQAEVGNVQGIWQEITCVSFLSFLQPLSNIFISLILRLSVNTMAGNLTTQVRGFAQISAAAMDGDFTRFITVEASGEMDSLKTQINQMVFNLRDSIQKNTAAREAAELANRSKSEFLANMSHEIRWVFLLPVELQPDGCM